MLKDFKAFVLRGNVLDLAIAVIIGTAFGKIITSLVNDIIMPPLGLLFGRVDFSSLFISLSGVPYASLPDAQAAGRADAQLRRVHPGAGGFPDRRAGDVRFDSSRHPQLSRPGRPRRPPPRPRASAHSARRPSA